MSNVTRLNSTGGMDVLSGPLLPLPRPVREKRRMRVRARSRRDQTQDSQGSVSVLLDAREVFSFSGSKPDVILDAYMRVDRNLEERERGR